MERKSTTYSFSGSNGCLTLIEESDNVRFMLLGFDNTISCNMSVTIKFGDRNKERLRDIARELLAIADRMEGS